MLLSIHLLHSGTLRKMSVAINSSDPRVRRTRQLLHEAFALLLTKKTFSEISVQDVTEAATLNRATFYAHYQDKYALLESTTAIRFADLLEKRAVSFDGTCNSALRKIFLGITDFMISVLENGPEHQTRLDPYMELAIIAVVNGMVLEGLNQYPADWKVSQDTLANTVSWGLYGAARNWISSPERGPAEDIVDGVTGLLAPLVHSS